MKTGITFDKFANGYARYGEKAFEIIKSHGYDCIDYNLMDTDTLFYRDGFEKEIKKEREKIESAGLKVFQTHGPWRWPPRDGTEDERVERLEKMKKAVISTAIFGAKYMVAHPIMPFGMEDVGSGREDETKRLNLEFWGELARFGETQGVVVCVENMPMPNLSVSTPRDLVELVQKIGSENLGICLDTGHVNVYPELNLGEEVLRIGKLLKTLHVHDNDGVRDSHSHPFTGTVDWKSFTNALIKIGFDGVINLETSPLGDLTGDEFLENGQCLANVAKTLASLSSEY